MLDDVNAFATEYATFKKAPIIGGAILYECLLDGKQWILVFKNALPVLTMSHHLISPFVLM
jgi:hypothetical protein